MLQTKRTVLRRLTRDDLDSMHLLESDPEVVKFIPLRVPISKEKSRERLEKQIESQKTQGGFGAWAVELKNTSEFIGWFMLIPADTARGTEYPEIGFMFLRRYWGNGFGAETSIEVIRYAFDVLGVSGVDAVTDEDNFASIAILQKLGFHFLKSFTTVDRVYNHEIILKQFRLLKWS